MIIDRVGFSLVEAAMMWQRGHPCSEGYESPGLKLGEEGFNRAGEGYSITEVRDLLVFLMNNNYTCNGGRVCRQIKGMPMGMPAAPQIANLACYPVEKDWAYRMGPGATAMVCRYIDDLYSAKLPGFHFPSAQDYGMEYSITSDGYEVIYLGVKVYVLREGDKQEVHTTVYDREEAYPYHIVRYPEYGTVAPTQQLGGVIMGRLVHCQETCSHMKDFKEYAANSFRHAMWRGYPRRLVQSVWSRFLFQRWCSTDIRGKELRLWFGKDWGYLQKTGGSQRPDPTRAFGVLAFSRLHSRTGQRVPSSLRSAY